jgi:hypothetical protein
MQSFSFLLNSMFKIFDEICYKDFGPTFVRRATCLRNCTAHMYPTCFLFPLTYLEPSLCAIVHSSPRVSPTVSRSLGQRSRLTRRERQPQEVMKLPYLGVEAGQESVVQVASCFRYAKLCHIFKKVKTSN